MKYINNKLKIEKVKVQDIAKKYGTPTYCYSYDRLKKNINNFQKNFKSFSPLICFSILQSPKLQVEFLDSSIAFDCDEEIMMRNTCELTR